MKPKPSQGPKPWGDHTADGSDARGDALPITIRIGPDGRVFFHDIPEGLVGVALSMNPDDPSMRERVRILSTLGPPTCQGEQA